MKIVRISIIVPTYNTANLLPRCINSLVNQTLQDIEIILIDDASTDNSLEILREYETKYPAKICVIASPENRRQGGARNSGIEAAQGEYLGFTDSDDWVEPTMYEELYNQAIKDNSDLCYCRRRQVTESGQISADDANYFMPVGNLTDEKRREILTDNLTFVQRYIYRRSLFTDHNIRFPEKLRYEDMLIDPLVIPVLQRIAAVDKPLYNYFIRSGSITTAVSDSKYRDKQRVSQMIVDEYKKRGFYENYKNEINYLYFRKGYIHAALNYIINAQRPKKEIITELKIALLEIDKNYRKNPYYRKKLSFAVIDRMLDNMLLKKMLKFILRLIKYNI
ncbi:MAG: glycosyltransferase [Paludibacter sp.]|jgi:glycosyltransferase involved in cell wall biosynthesis|nr:glycosyltransferase [Paludibacter sp.]